MELRITHTDEKPLLARKEIKAQISFQGATPSNAELKKALASQAKADENAVVLKGIYTAFGATEAEVNAYIYNSVEDMKKFEPKKFTAEPKKKAAAEGEAA